LGGQCKPPESWRRRVGRWPVPCEQHTPMKSCNTLPKA